MHMAWQAGWVLGRRDDGLPRRSAKAIAARKNRGHMRKTSTFGICSDLARPTLSPKQRNCPFPEWWAPHDRRLWSPEFVASTPDVGLGSMNSSLLAAFARRASTRPAQGTFLWSCAPCRAPRAKAAIPPRPSTGRQHGSGRRSYSSRTTAPPPRRAGRAILYVSAAGAAVAATTVAEDVKGTVEGAQRAGRVASALFICINE